MTDERRRRRKAPAPTTGRSGPVEVWQVHPSAMAEAQRVRRPGERLKVVSPTEVWLVPDTD